LLPLAEIFRRLSGEGPPLQRAVGFTIDDGYLDQAEVAGPIFAEFDCPVTTFVCTGFLDADLWMWWDKIEYVFRHTSRSELSAGSGEGKSCRWADDPERGRAQYDFTEACKELTDLQKHAAIQELAVKAEVALPEAAPAEYAPMSWEQLRSCARGTMSFGPHTVTHPVLSRVSDENVRDEIARSAERLAAECENPDPIFCYPNGQVGDFGPREFRILEDLGFPGAVTGYPGYASAQSWDADPHDRFCVRRFSYPGNLTDLLQCVTGAERLKSILRGENRA
jgi:peptidoglycan/xylan/chitin deacetylase (PgdA/CDA1 family)